MWIDIFIMHGGIRKLRILVCVDWFEPGFKAGGPITSIANFVRVLKDDLDIYVITSDRDLGDHHAYPYVKVDMWVVKDGFKVCYCSPKERNWRSLRKVISQVQADYLYLNSMFSKYFAIYPLLMKRMRIVDGGVVLAPRGMLRLSALSRKSFKKEVFLFFAKIFGLYKEITFHATDFQEEIDISILFGNQADIHRASNLPGIQLPFSPILSKFRRELKIIFVGRIHPIKNLHYLLAILQECEKKVEILAIAPVEDADYWSECSRLVRLLPANISFKHLASVPNRYVRSHILESHVLILPTLGENFGHAISESLSLGRPVIISDQTPWNDVNEKKAGWVFSLKDRTAFLETVNLLADMDLNDINDLCKNAWEYYYRFLSSTDIRGNYLKMFS